MKLPTIEKYTEIFNKAIQAKKPLREYCKENKVKNCKQNQHKAVKSHI